MSGKSFDMLACCNIPQANRITPPSGCDGLSIKAESNALNNAFDTILTPLEGCNLFTSGNIPQANGIVPASTREDCALRIKSNGEDMSPMAKERLQNIPGLNIPETYGRVSCRACEGCAIRTESDTLDTSIVSEKGS